VDDDEALRALQELWLKLVIRVDLGGTCALAPACRAFAGEALSPLQLEQLAMLLARTRREEAEPPSPSHARPISVMAQRVAEILEVAADDRSFGSAAALSYDARHHELRGKGARVSLKTRPVLRRLFFALAAQANRLVDREELTLAVWNRPYHPQAHDAVLRVNVSTLRRLVAPFGLTIEFDETGYRLYAPDGLGLVEEAGRDAAPIPCILRKA
jgi:DNA-binding response OmpR family regulator